MIERVILSGRKDNADGIWNHHIHICDGFQPKTTRNGYLMSEIDEMPESVKAKQDEETTANLREWFCRWYFSYSESDYFYTCKEHHWRRYHVDGVEESVG